MGATSQHFSDTELRCHGNECAECRAGQPQKNECSQGLLDALELFRDAAVVFWVKKFQKSVGNFPGVHVNDAYRCPDHNSSTPNSAKASEHMLGRAADVRVLGLTAAELEGIARKIPAIKGIGRADTQQYLHIDVRNTPTVAQWCYDFDGATCKYYPPVTPA